jgi:amino acid transporter
MIKFADLKSGSGIFVNAGSVFESTNSTGVSLMLWVTGVLYAICGVIIYIEYGLSVPRRSVLGKEMAVPRSGGDLNYLQFVYRWPAYGTDTIQFITAFFGIPFLFFGTMAGGAINFGIHVLQASNPGFYGDVNSHSVRGIAIAISIASCFIHTLSRRGGLLLSNTLAAVKVGILLLMVIVTIVYAANGFPQPKNASGPVLPFNQTISQTETMTQNFGIGNSFSNASKDAYGYSASFLDVIFTFSGFEQANYVLGEIGRPHRKFPIGLGVSVGIVSALYVAVNICYWVVVPQFVVNSGVNIAEAFFTLTLGSLSSNPREWGRRISSAFVAVSALGNIIVMTYTASRVKQEIAKEGILPWPKFFAQNYDLSLGRILLWVQNKKSINKRLSFWLRTKWLAPENFQEKTPVGAMILHLVTCFILIVGTWSTTAYQTYNLVTGTGVYVINAFFGSMLAIGILYLRMRRSAEWSKKSTRIPPIISLTAASLYLILNLFPVAANWIPPATVLPGSLTWYLIPMISFITLGAGAIWWLGFFIVARRKDKETNTVLTVSKVPEFAEEPPHSGLYVQTHETVYICRRGKDFAADLGDGRNFSDFKGEFGREVVEGNGIRSDFDMMPV